MSSMASQITSLTIFSSIVYSGADQRKHQSSASLSFERGIHWWPMNSQHKGPVTRKMFPFDYVILCTNGLVKVVHAKVYLMQWLIVYTHICIYVYQILSIICEYLFFLIPWPFNLKMLYVLALHGVFLFQSVGSDSARIYSLLQMDPSPRQLTLFCRRHFMRILVKENFIDP